MNINDFELERYFAKYEFMPDMMLLSSSDCDGLKQAEIVSWADDETLAMWDGLALGYTESLGNPVLRQEVAQLYSDISLDDVLILAPEEGIFIAMNVLLHSGDHVITTFPGYQSLYEVANSIGCSVEKWQPDESKGWHFAPESLAKMIKPATRAIVINFPHNPTGFLPSHDEFEQILGIAEKYGLYVFSDEMYRFLEINASDRLPSAVEAYDKSISLFGMSKTFGMAGARLGWLVTKDKALYDKMAKFKDYTTICPPAPSEILSLIALRNKYKILERHLSRIRRNLSHLDSFFQEFPNLFTWVRPRAGTIGFSALLNGDSSAGFCERVIHEAHVMLLPSKVYGYDDKHFRLGFGRENLPAALDRLRGFLTRKG